MTASPRSTFGYSFASMLIGMALLSLVMYATVRPSAWAASLAFTVAIAALSLALIRAASCGDRRRYLLAFSLAGFAYLGMLYLPVADERVGAWLITTTGFAGLEASLYEESADRSDNPQRLVVQQRGRAQLYWERAVGPVARLNGGTADRALPQETWAGRVFHSMFALACGLVAGWVATLPGQRNTAARDGTFGK